MWGKKRKLPNVIKVLSNMMLELHNVRNVLSNARKKNKGITKCDKRNVKYDVGITLYENGTIKCENKIRKPLNVTKELSLVMLNMMMKPSNLWKNKETTKYDKITVIYDVKTTQ